MNRANLDAMKTVLTTMLIAFSWGCATPVKPVPKAPAATVLEEPTPSSFCPNGATNCTNPNGTQATGLARDDRAGTIRAVTLTSGENVILR